MKAAELFVKYLEKEGVEYMFGVISFKNPDFVKYVENFGVKGYRVERAVDLLPSLKQARPTRHPWQSSTVPWTTRRT
jgi:thiamine pyrophosphate-dependent acetolactate synthase large subunit-like protein